MNKIVIFEKDGQLACLKIETDVNTLQGKVDLVGNYIPAREPQSLLFVHTNREEAKKAFNEARLKSEKENDWKPIYSGSPNFG